MVAPPWGGLEHPPPIRSTPPPPWAACPPCFFLAGTIDTIDPQSSRGKGGRVDNQLELGKKGGGGEWRAGSIFCVNGEDKTIAIHKPPLGPFRIPYEQPTLSPSFPRSALPLSRLLTSFLAGDWPFFEPFATFATFAVGVGAHFTSETRFALRYPPWQAKKRLLFPQDPERAAVATPTWRVPLRSPQIPPTVSGGDISSHRTSSCLLAHLPQATPCLVTKAPTTLRPPPTKPASSSTTISRRWRLQVWRWGCLRVHWSGMGCCWCRGRGAGQGAGRWMGRGRGRGRSWTPRGRPQHGIAARQQRQRRPHQRPEQEGPPRRKTRRRRRRRQGSE